MKNSFLDLNKWLNRGVNWINRVNIFERLTSISTDVLRIVIQIYVSLQPHVIRCNGSDFFFQPGNICVDNEIILARPKGKRGKNGAFEIRILFYNADARSVEFNMQIRRFPRA